MQTRVTVPAPWTLEWTTLVLLKPFSPARTHLVSWLLLCIVQPSLEKMSRFGSRSATARVRERVVGLDGFVSSGSSTLIWEQHSLLPKGAVLAGGAGRMYAVEVRIPIGR